MYSSDELNFLQVAIYLNMLPPEKGEEILEEKAHLQRQGRKRGLFQLLQEKKILSPRKLKKIRKILRRGYFYCVTCRIIIIRGSEKPNTKRLCPQCQSPLQSSVKESRKSLKKPTIRRLRLKPCHYFSVLKTLGQGGFGHVYQIRDPLSGRSLAAKILHPHKIGDWRARKRFQREIQVTSLLEHPNIMPVYQSGFLENGSQYYIMKELKGGSLKDQLEGGKEITLPEKLEMFLKICEALSFAHSQGVVHRDLKPANIAIGDFGEVLVLDWGMAKMNGDDKIEELGLPGFKEKITQQGRTVGSPGYMAPEQAKGKAVDRRADIFSLGIILYEILTGRKAFPGRNRRERLMVSIMKEAEPAHEVCPGEVSPILSQIAARAMAKDPAERYQTVEELRRAVLGYLHNQSLPKTPPPPAPKRKLQKEENLFPYFLAGMVCLTIISITAIVFWA